MLRRSNFMPMLFAGLLCVIVPHPAPAQDDQNPATDRKVPTASAQPAHSREPSPPVGQVSPATGANTFTRYLPYGMIVLLLVVAGMVLRRRHLQSATTDSTAGVPPGVRLTDVSRVTGKKDYPLATTIVQIGRAAGPPIPDVAYIVIEQKTVSRHHAVIEYRNLAFWVMDQGSCNGTWLNGRLLTKECCLKHGDTLLFDRIEFSFHETGTSHAGATIIQASGHPQNADAVPGNNDTPEVGDNTAPQATGVAATESESDPSRQAMTADEFDRLFAKIDKSQKND